MSNVVIRLANIDDLEKIASIEKSYPYETYSKIELTKMFGYDYYRFLIAKIDDKIVGYICATIIMEECNLMKIIVGEKFRTNGIGKKLVSKLKDICMEQNVKYIYLEVRSTNSVAIEFYKKLGFGFDGIRKGYYNGVDACIYRLII